METLTIEEGALRDRFMNLLQASTVSIIRERCRISPVRLGTSMGPPLKKSLFPVQLVAEIMVSQAAAKSFLFLFVFFL